MMSRYAGEADVPTDEQITLAANIGPAVRRCRRALQQEMKRPGVIHVSPEVFDILCPDGPVFVWALPYPQIMGLPIHPNSGLRGTSVAVTERI